MNNVTGWDKLHDGNLVGASWELLDTATNGWFASILFMLYLFVLYNKTNSVPALVGAGILFIGLYGTVLNLVTGQLIFMIIVLILAGIIQYVVKK